jgi:small subunit ribosomal protein S5
MLNNEMVGNQDTGEIELLVHVNRTTKVVKGGRQMGFSALTVVGDGKGRIGIGRGKSKEVPVAISKAMTSARRNMINVQLNGHTLWHEVIGHHGGTKVFMKPASKGTGIIAGGAMRAAFQALGVKNVLAKTIGSSNPYNVLRAVIDGFSKIVTPEQIAEKRGKTIEEILK